MFIAVLATQTIEEGEELALRLPQGGRQYMFRVRISVVPVSHPNFAALFHSSVIVRPV